VCNVLLKKQEFEFDVFFVLASCEFVDRNSFSAAGLGHRLVSYPWFENSLLELNGKVGNLIWIASRMFEDLPGQDP
jgi:hypothetical protein